MVAYIQGRVVLLVVKIQPWILVNVNPVCIITNMKTARPILPIGWMKFICILAGLYAIAVISYIFIETEKPLGSRDFHQFWYAGHFILQGRDPYEAFFAKEPPSLPVEYLGGVTITEYPIAQPELEITPSNTPAMLMLLSPFAHLSWEHAKWSFLAVNMVLMLVTGWLVLRVVPFGGVRLGPLQEILIFLVYFDSSATRIAIENGQTTLLVFLLMLVAVLYARRSWPIAGLALGVALSKYSLSLPVFLFLLYKRNFKVLIPAIAVQFLAIFAMTAITGSSPLMIISENIQLFFRLFDQPGVHLSRWFEFLSENQFVSVIPSLLMTLLVFVPLIIWLHKAATATTALQDDVIDFHVLTILFIWVILVAYHRLYDTLILIFFTVLVFKGLALRIWKFAGKGKRTLLLFLATLPLILIVPARIVDLFFTEYYGRVSDAVTTFFLVIMLMISMYLLRRYLQKTHIQTIGQKAETHEIRNDTHRDTQPGWADYTQSAPGDERPQQPAHARSNGGT